MERVKNIVTLALAVMTFVSLIWFATAVAGRGNMQGSPAEPERLAAIERRIEKLQSPQIFTVESEQGKPLFAIFSQIKRPGSSELPANLAVVYNASGQGVVFMRAYDGGGVVETLSVPGNFRTSIAACDDCATGFHLTQRNQEKDGSTKEFDRVVLGESAETEEGKSRNYSLRFLTESGGVIAGIGESKAGSGALVVGDSKGSRRVSMTVGDKDKGLIGLFSLDNKPILSFGEAVGNDGGSLAIGDANSEPMVKMGSNANRYGVVLTFPPGFPYVPRSGLPGSFFLGCTSGSKTCVLP